MVDGNEVLRRSFDGDNDRLKTDATIVTGDLQIGAVEIKDHDSSTRLDIVTSGETIAAPTSQVISGHDGSNSRLLSTDASGNQNVNLQAGDGTDITETAGALDVNISSGGVSFPGDDADLDSGAGTDDHGVVAIGLPGAGGHVVGGTSSDPLRTDPTGTTTQPVSDASGSLTVDNATLDTAGGGTEAAAQRVTIANDSTGLLSVDDNGGSLTVDNSTLDTAGGGTEASAQRVTIANDSTGLLSVDDNGGSLTIDNTTIDTVGGGTEAAAQRVTIANDSTGLLSVDDNGGSLTVDNATLDTSGGGTEAAAQRVTIANDSTGLLSVDDNGGSLTVDQVSTASTVGASHNTAEIMDGTTALTPKFAIIDAASSGNNTLVAAVSTKKIRVLSLFLVAAGTVVTRFESGAGGTALSGQMNLVANSGFTLPFNPVGWFETAATTLLNLELDGAVSVDGALTYVEV